MMVGVVGDLKDFSLVAMVVVAGMTVVVATDGVRSS